MTRARFAVGLLAGVSTLSIGYCAWAQTAPAARDAAVEEIVVTGSRVIANGNNSPTPVTVVQTEELRTLQPTTINDALNNLPVFQGSRGQFSQPNTTGLFGGGNPATTQLNLRNLAPQRTLILFDGQRVAPTNGLGIVDVDMIPEGLIQRVDIVTGGVSAVYGSDGIAGVVNYVTDKNFNGFKADASYGVSDRGDDKNWRGGFAAGTSLFDGRGHIEGSYNHFDNDGLPHRNMREYWDYSLLGATPGATVGQGTAANPYALFKGTRNAQNSFGGMITNGPLRGQHFETNGVLSVFDHGALTGTPNTEVGGDGSYGGQNSLKAPVNFDQVFGRFDFSLSDAVHFHVQGSGNWKDDTTYSNPTSFNNRVFSTSNAFLTPAQRALLNPTGATSTFTFSKNYREIPLLEQVSKVRNLFVNTGLDGTFGKYKWAMDVNYSDNIIHDEFRNNINSQKLSAAQDAVVNPANGQIVCNASLTDPNYANCVPYNAFGPTSASAAAIAYVTETTHLVPSFKQWEVNGSVSGPIFTLPAGPVNGALSAEWRKQTFAQDADALPTQFNPCTTAMRFNCGPQTVVYQVAFAKGEPASQSVKEGAAEVDVPLLKDLPLFQSLNVNGAIRYTDYDFGGKATTWKLGLDWHVNDDVRIRATRSRDIEAPTLAMLFQPLLVAFIGNQDLLTGASPQVPAKNTGNPNLVSEVGHTWTAGIVWQPHWAPGFSVSLDGYHIRVNGALIQIQGQAAVTQQLCYADPANSPYCRLQERPLGNYTNRTAANTVTGWIDEFQNVSKIETYGADLEVNYARQVFDRAFNARLLVTYQPHYLYAQPGAPTYDFGNVTFPNLVPLQAVPAVQLTASVNYALTSKLRLNITERWRSAMDLEPAGLGIFPDGPKSYATTNVNLTYQVRGPGNEIYVNVRNLFDNLATPTVGLSGSGGYPQTDDPVGRYFTVGVRARF